MEYKINNKPIEDFGLVAGRQNSSNIAIAGCWDMPSRIGKVFHDWKDENGVEPYLRADEIFFGGRDISLYCWLAERNRGGFVGAIQSLYDYIDTLQGSVFPLSSEFGIWDVQLLEASPVSYLNQGFGNIELRFRQPVVEMIGALPTTTSAGVGIDNYSFSQLGIVKMLTKDQANRPASKQWETTAYGVERIGPVRRNMREFTIDFFLDHPSYNSFKSCINNLQYLFSRPNARTLRLDDNTTREFFVKDGFKVTNVRVTPYRVTAFLSLPLAEIRMLENWNKLTDSTNLILVDKHGQPLTELLKGF